MSLLLDALKKAEREKQKAREAEAAGIDNDDQQSGQVITSDRSTGPEHVEPTQDVKSSYVEEIAEELELTLDEYPAAEQDFVEDPSPEAIAPAAEPPAPQVIELAKSSATTTTVSDEALKLLVYKTNKRYRQRQKIIWGSLVSAAIVILLAAGAFYYYGVLEEIDALERKHKLAMQVVHAEPIRAQVSTTVEQSDSVAPIEKAQVNAVDKRAVKKSDKNKTRATDVAPVVKQDFSIKQTKIEDPINTLLKDAWLAYNRADYTEASRAYENVLKREPKNRDALLGMAAIAVKIADYKKAKASYRLLLKLDPRDQVAMAAMSNIDELSSSSQDESKLKFMLQQQPSATHLNFALGNLYAKKGRWPEAQAEYFKAWQGSSENADYVYNLAVSLDQLGKPNEALRFYKECLLFGRGQNIGFSITDVENRIEAISLK